jgi:energy-coupling factor transporter ATP-binding protein EcfA2
MPKSLDIKIARRFQRSVRIDTDMHADMALDGFVCPQSARDVLTTMAEHVNDTGQAAFTWTGPYGSGKSTLAVVLSALVGPNKPHRVRAERLIGTGTCKTVLDVFAKQTGRTILPIVARRAAPATILGEALEDAGIERRPKNGWDEKSVIKALLLAAKKPAHGSGLLVIIDELGKCLEAAAQDGADLFCLQELAETANRSGGHLVIVGVLHQAFGDYASRLSGSVRDEWAKIQGRFVDLTVNTAGEEQIDLIGQAIESNSPPRSYVKEVRTLAKTMRGENTAALEMRLSACWPLNPIVACLLGPISRRRFGQNQRSVFGFLNSAELFGFQHFLKEFDGSGLYQPSILWDYLRTNLEPSILASPDSHRWATAADAVDRCISSGADPLTVDLLKTIAIIDLFKDRSGVLAKRDVLKGCLPKVSAGDFKSALSELEDASLIVFRKFKDAFAIYAGSDFNIEKAVQAEVKPGGDIDFGELKRLLGLQPLLAKRHYRDTGAMRWFDVHIAPISGLIAIAKSISIDPSAIGHFVLAFPTRGESEELAQNTCARARRIGDEVDIIIGQSPRTDHILPYAQELAALKRISETNLELRGDPVARREVHGRIASLQARLESELQSAFDEANWTRKGAHQSIEGGLAGLNSVASDLAGKRYHQSIILPNELLNRAQPSSSARSAQSALLRAMVTKSEVPRLGIKDYPPEGGLFASILENTGLFGADDTGHFSFRSPNPKMGDPANLTPMWDAAKIYIKSHKSGSLPLSDIYDIWRAAPFGIKDGLMPVLAVAFLEAEAGNLAIYYEGTFRSRLSEVDVERLARNASEIQLRWMKIDNASREMLSGLSDLVTELRGEPLHNLTPLDVAKGLVKAFDGCPLWTHRTSRLSAHAIRMRDTFKRARDPNKLLFDDLPNALSDAAGLPMEENTQTLVDQISEGMREIMMAYPAMLTRLRDLTLEELQVPNTSAKAIAELRSRAANISQTAGDYRIEAFVQRLADYDGTAEEFGKIASLSIGKEMQNWIDLDIDQATIELADMAQRFLRAESFARVKGRDQTRRALSVVIGMEGSPAPISEEFAVQRGERQAVEQLIAQLQLGLEQVGVSDRHIILAALTEISLRYMESDVDLGFKLPVKAGAHR